MISSAHTMEEARSVLRAWLRVEREAVELQQKGAQFRHAVGIDQHSSLQIPPPSSHRRLFQQQPSQQQPSQQQPSQQQQQTHHDEPQLWDWPRTPAVPSAATPSIAASASASIATGPSVFVSPSMGDAARDDVGDQVFDPIRQLREAAQRLDIRASFSSDTTRPAAARDPTLTMEERH